MSASATSSRGVRKAPPEYVHPPPPVRPYTNVHQGDGRPLGDIQLEERVRRGGGARADERPDLNSFTTKKSVSAGKKINYLLHWVFCDHRSFESGSLQFKFRSGDTF